MYHGVVPDNYPIDSWTLVRESEFRKQMDVLAKHYEVIPLGAVRDFCDRSNGGNASKKPTAIITFDDGYRNNYTVAFPILKEYGFHAAIFVCPGLLNQNDMVWYDKVIYAIQRSSCANLTIDSRRYDFDSPERSKRWVEIDALLAYLKTRSEQDRSRLVDEIVRSLNAPLDQSECFAFLSEEEVRILRDSGLISIGSHTTDHEILTKIPISRAKETIISSVREIERIIGEDVMFFAYPNGDYNRDILGIVRTLPIQAAFTTTNDLYSAKYDRLEIPRVSVGGYDGLSRFLVSLITRMIGLGSSLLYLNQLPLLA